MHHTDARHDDTHPTDRHPTGWVSARRAFWVVAALIVGCSSNDDVVAEVEPTALAPWVGGVMVRDGTFAPDSAGGMPVVGGSTAGATNVADPNATGPSAGSSAAPVPLLPPPSGTPLSGALFVSGAPSAEPGDSARRWPFVAPLRQVFGVPTPGAPGITLRVTDPPAIQTLRELLGDDGVSPIVDPALVTVVDGMEDRYDLAIWESE
jgi:hypothetical protein